MAAIVSFLHTRCQALRSFGVPNIRQMNLGSEGDNEAFADVIIAHAPNLALLFSYCHAFPFENVLDRLIDGWPAGLAVWRFPGALKWEDHGLYVSCPRLPPPIGLSAADVAKMENQRRAKAGGDERRSRLETSKSREGEGVRRSGLWNAYPRRLPHGSNRVIFLFNEEESALYYSRLFLVFQVGGSTVTFSSISSAWAAPPWLVFIHTPQDDKYLRRCINSLPLPIAPDPMVSHRRGNLPAMRLLHSILTFFVILVHIAATMAQPQAVMPAGSSFANLVAVLPVPWQKTLQLTPPANATTNRCCQLKIICTDGVVTRIYLWSNSLTSSIPASLGNLVNLTDLSVKYSFPESPIGRLTNLVNLTDVISKALIRNLLGISMTVLEVSRVNDCDIRGGSAFEASDVLLSPENPSPLSIAVADFVNLE
ncbi:hypothetical protein BDK51DRAFT_32700 [Blyttiomyces helicus]|uniref:Leucine-rich repeat-containing N-terminal plant-type domain-containing protein n=1 Tax=Blyttiomyces helicus TaxID=388810 RepID=A0A4P9WS90_9FUNG|nr:hypothetical protein BDK51DRAFT_32700 [Blyttiomyces helicus]|eukprot:RKO94818.1 hypothetical protein BDK51DRAFT_32700 [Blyttiomyces helicus]